jgi:hypothetical protein
VCGKTTFIRQALPDWAYLDLDRPSDAVPFEIKLHSAPGESEARGVRRCMADLGLRRGYVLHPGKNDCSLGSGVTAISTPRLLAHPAELAHLP